MTDIEQGLGALKISNPRRAAAEVHAHLLALITAGRIPPGTILSQAGLARALNVSRTPVREALRLLQERGLIHAEPDYRARVMEFDVDALEALYCKRVMLEALGVAVTVPRSSEAELRELSQALNQLTSDVSHTGFAEFVAANRQFHALLVRHCGKELIRDIEDLSQRSEIYMSLYESVHGDRWWARPEVDHVELFAAFQTRRAALATRLIARHLAHTAFALMNHFAPTHEPVRLRAALQIAMAAGNAVETAVIPVEFAPRPSAAAGRGDQEPAGAASAAIDSPTTGPGPARRRRNS